MAKPHDPREAEEKAKKPGGQQHQNPPRKTISDNPERNPCDQKGEVAASSRERHDDWGDVRLVTKSVGMSASSGGGKDDPRSDPPIERPPEPIPEPLRDPDTSQPKEAPPSKKPPEPAPEKPPRETPPT